MTTVVDPSGTPSPVYNKSGTTVIEMAATGLNQAGAAPIVALSGHTVVLATPSADENGDHTGDGVALPSAAVIGDVVEVYIGTVNLFVKVYPPSGNNLNLASNGVVKVDRGTAPGAIFRKVTSNGWWSVGGTI